MGKILGSQLKRKAPTIRDVLLQPEYATVRVTTALFGLSRTMIFRLIKERRIRSIHFKGTDGTDKGVRLIDLESVREHLKTYE